MNSVRIELAKLSVVGTRITYQATGEACGCFTAKHAARIMQVPGTPQYKALVHFTECIPHIRRRVVAAYCSRTMTTTTTNSNKQ